MDARGNYRRRNYLHEKLHTNISSLVLLVFWHIWLEKKEKCEFKSVYTH